MDQIVYAGKHALTMAVSRHIHSSWELILCTSGNGQLIFDDQTLNYGANDIAIIPPGLPHSNKSEEGFTNIHLNLTDLTLTDTEPRIVHGDSNGFLQNAFSAAFYYYSGASEKRSVLLPRYGQLITAFLTTRQPEWTHSDIIREIENHILHNYPDCNYDLNAYLHSLPFNAEYLKKLFKKETSFTPLQYLTNLRLENAAKNLSMTEGKGRISEIARQCGISDPLYFSRLFKKRYGISPRNYAAANRNPPTSDSDSIKTIL